MDGIEIDKMCSCLAVHKSPTVNEVIGNERDNMQYTTNKRRPFLVNSGAFVVCNK
jgi:hypothetical protein